MISCIAVASVVAISRVDSGTQFLSSSDFTVTLLTFCVTAQASLISARWL